MFVKHLLLYAIGTFAIGNYDDDDDDDDDDYTLNLAIEDEDDDDGKGLCFFSQS